MSKRKDSAAATTIIVPSGTTEVPWSRSETGKQIATLMTMVAHRYCVSVLAKQKNRPPVQCATGTLLQVAD